jgi:hypothetical protein
MAIIRTYSAGKGVATSAITPHDTDVINYDAFYVGDISGGATMKIKSRDDSAWVTLSGLIAGRIYPITIKGVHTDTTASGLVGLSVEHK